MIEQPSELIGNVGLSVLRKLQQRATVDVPPYDGNGLSRSDGCGLERPKIVCPIDEKGHSIGTHFLPTVSLRDRNFLHLVCTESRSVFHCLRRLL